MQPTLSWAHLASEGKRLKLGNYGDGTVNAVFRQCFKNDLVALRQNPLSWEPVKIEENIDRQLHPEHGRMRKIHVFENPGGRKVVVRTMLGSSADLREAFHLGVVYLQKLPFEKPLAVVQHLGHPKGRVDYITEFAEGYKSVEEFLKTSGSSERDEMIAKVMEKIRYLHDKDIIHGDLHEENILYHPEKKKVLFIDTEYLGLEGKEAGGRFSTWLNQLNMPDNVKNHKLFDLAYLYRRLGFNTIWNLKEITKQNYKLNERDLEKLSGLVNLLGSQRKRKWPSFISLP